MPLCLALLPNKTTSTYKMFSSLRTALEMLFGTIGSVETFLVDFEQAAIGALKEVFPEVTVKGCTFHFRQAVIRHLQQEGLRSKYESTTEHPDVHLWMCRTMAMTMLPEFAIPLCWDVRNPPLTGDSVVDAKTSSFADYFNRTWISGSFPPRLWSHFDNVGPRRTNLAEGYHKFHNSLNSRFGMAHPSLTSFLNWLQKYQFEVQCRGIHLAAGQPPKQ